jgi:hypothetical protein
VLAREAARPVDGHVHLFGLPLHPHLDPLDQQPDHLLAIRCRRGVRLPQLRDVPGQGADLLPFRRRQLRWLPSAEPPILFL